MGITEDQIAVPPENRVRRDNRRDVGQYPTAEALTDDGKTPTFVVSEPHAPAMELRLQYAILFPQEFDNVALLPFEPAGQRRDDRVRGTTIEVYAKARIQLSDSTAVWIGFDMMRRARSLTKRRESGFCFVNKAYVPSRCRLLDHVL